MSNNIKKETENIVLQDNNLYEFSRNLIINSRKIVYQTPMLPWWKPIDELAKKLWKNRAE